MSQKNYSPYSPPYKFPHTNYSILFRVNRTLNEMMLDRGYKSFQQIKEEKIKKNSIFCVDEENFDTADEIKIKGQDFVKKYKNCHENIEVMMKLYRKHDEYIFVSFVAAPEDKKQITALTFKNLITTPLAHISDKIKVQSIIAVTMQDFNPRTFSSVDKSKLPSLNIEYFHFKDLIQNKSKNYLVPKIEVLDLEVAKFFLEKYGSENLPKIPSNVDLICRMKNIQENNIVFIERNDGSKYFRISRNFQGKYLNQIKKKKLKQN